jgi:two-component system, NtrC family, sensor kinase
MKFNLGIRAQLSAGIVLTTLAGIGLIGLLSIKIVENNAVYWKINEAGRIIKLVRSSVQRSGASGYPPEALKFTAAALKGAGVTDYRIADAAGKEVLGAGSVTKEPGADIPYPDLTVLRVGGGLFQGPGRLLLVSAPFDGTGSIEFAVPLGDIKAEMAGVRKFLFFYALLDSAIIIIFGVYFLSRSITGPLKKLDIAATRIAGGKLGERADVAVDNEVGSLASSFNVMAGRLETEIKSLERVNLELMSTQEELLRSSTLAAVGRLAAGIAHEIGNPLGALHGYLDILSKGIDDREAENDIIARASKEVSRIDLIVREFLEIARPPRKPSVPVDINRVVEETVSTVAIHKDFADVDSKLALTEGLPPVTIDDGKLRQVFMNLLLNAAQSMSHLSGGKTVLITTSVEKRAEGPRMRRRKDDPPPVKGLIPSDREFVVIKFTDNGSGISEQDASKIFDPFFTTKEIGKGTGLGLFISQSILKTYGGGISFEGVKGGGSTFTVILPTGR